MAYDTESDRVIVFGGFSGSAHLSDTWAYDFNGNTWTQMRPTSLLTPRTGHAMTYDSQSDRIVLFGGTTPLRISTDQTWAYDFNTDTWTELKPPLSPSPRAFHAMAYDAGSDRVILFGGGPNGSPIDGETWAFDLESNTWLAMSPARQPPGLAYHAMAYDSSADRVLLIGGQNVGGLFGTDIWVYDYDTDIWTSRNPVFGVVADESAMAFDSGSDHTVLYDGSTFLYDFKSNEWKFPVQTRFPNSTGPIAIAYDSESDRIILFGGILPGAEPSQATDETWAFTLAPPLTANPRFPMDVIAAAAAIAVGVAIVLWALRRIRREKQRKAS